MPTAVQSIAVTRPSNLLQEPLWWASLICKAWLLICSTGKTPQQIASQIQAVLGKFMLHRAYVNICCHLLRVWKVWSPITAELRQKLDRYYTSRPEQPHHSCASFSDMTSSLGASAPQVCKNTGGKCGKSAVAYNYNIFSPPLISWSRLHGQSSTGPGQWIKTPQAKEWISVTLPTITSNCRKCRKYLCHCAMLLR